MSETKTKRACSICPCLRYGDAPAAIKWLEQAFGFEKKMAVNNPDGTIAHAEIRLGDGLVMLGSAKGDSFGYISPRDAGGVTQSIYIVLDDVDAHYRRAKAAGAEIVIDLHDTDYGSRDYSAKDPEGHLWHFGTYDPAAPPPM